MLCVLLRFLSRPAYLTLVQDAALVVALSSISSAAAPDTAASPSPGDGARFDVAYGDRVLQLRAPSNDDRDLWISAIRAASQPQ
jgi:hypothetical protein